jgi:four helix bundle protein
MESLTSKAVKSFRDLRVWQSAYDLTMSVYALCKSFPRHEQYGLGSQMTRAAVSVCSNIAEGFGRRSVKEKDQFYSIANGSLTELENQLLVAYGVGYITKQTLQEVADICSITHRMLNTLQKVNSKR